MEHKQLLETLILDILNDPHSPMNQVFIFHIQYRDSQISHICKCMGLSDLGGLKSQTFQQQFAKRFIDHLYQNNEINPLIEQASINRKSKQDLIQIKKKTYYDHDVVQIIDDDGDKEPRIDVEASFVKALTGGPNFSGHQFNFNNYQISKSNDHNKASSTKTEKPSGSIQKELKNIPELIPKKKIEQNEIFRKAQQVLEKYETIEKGNKKDQPNSKSKEKKQKERLDIIKKKKGINENFKLDSQSESLDIRVMDSGSHREEGSKKYDDAKKEKLIKKLNKEKEMQQIAKQKIKKNKLEEIKKKTEKGKEKLEKIKKIKKDKPEKLEKVIQENGVKESAILEKDKLEKIKQDKEKLDQEKQLRERVEMEILEKERIEKERIEQERKEKLRLEEQEQERLDREKEQQEIKRIEKEAIEKQQQQEKERLEKERQDKEEKELEKQRQQKENERLEKEKQDKEDRVRQDKQRSEKDLEKQSQDTRQKELSRQRETEAIETILEKLLCQQQDNNNNSSDTSQTRKAVVEQRKTSPKNEKQKKKHEKESKKIEKPQCRYCKYVNVKLIELSDGVNICPECLLYDINPFSKILQKIGSMEHKVSGKEGARVSTTFVIENVGNHNLEIRCVLMSKLGISDITFPMFCTLMINGIVVREFKPLQDKSCLKKRKDVSVILNLRDLLRQHNFSRKYTFACVEHVPDARCRKDEVGAYYYFGFYLVECQNVKQVIETFKRQDFQPVTQSDSCKNEIKIDRLRVSLTCQFSLELMQIPGKGEFCQHQQCFCLNSYLEMMSKAEHRKWICPICRKVCFHLVVDKGQQFIIDRIRKLEIQVDTVSLDQNGQLEIGEEPISKIILDESITKYQDIIDKEYKSIPKMIKNDDEEELPITQNQGKNNNQAIILIDD